MTPKIRALLVDADSYLSLVAHRYRVSTIPDDVVEEMLRTSSGCRAAVEAHDRAADPAPAAVRHPSGGAPGGGSCDQLAVQCPGCHSHFPFGLVHECPGYRFAPAAEQGEG